ANLQFRWTRAACDPVHRSPPGSRRPGRTRSTGPVSKSIEPGADTAWRLSWDAARPASEHRRRPSGGPRRLVAGRDAPLGLRPKTQPDLWAPCTPSPALPPAVLSHALEGAPSAPRRRHRIWGTWTPNLSARFPAAPLGAAGIGRVAQMEVAPGSGRRLRCGCDD